MLNPNNDIKIFTTELIKNTWEHKEPSVFLSDYLYDLVRKASGKIDIDENYIQTIIEFNLGNMIFLKKLFNKNKNNLAEESQETKEFISNCENDLFCSLLNLMSRLIQLEDENFSCKNEQYSENMSYYSNNMNNSNLNYKELASLSNNLQITDESQKHTIENKNNINYQMVNAIDVTSIAKTKLSQLKIGLISIYKEYSKSSLQAKVDQMNNEILEEIQNEIKAMENTKATTKNDKNKQAKPNVVVLQEKLSNTNPTNITITYDLFVPEHISKIITHLNINYLPFIKLYFLFCNVERDIEYQKLEFVINKPMEIIGLNNAISYTDDKEEKIRIEKEAEEFKQKKKLEEEESEKERIKLVEEQKLLKEQELLKEQALLNKEKTYLDILNDLNLSEETKQMIIEAIEKMHDEINMKVSDRQRRLDDKLKDVELIVKGKKK